MKKCLSLLLLWAVLLSCAAGGAEAALETFDFGDFSMDIAPDVPGSISEKKDGAAFITLFPAAGAQRDAACVFSVAWRGAQTDLSTAQGRSGALGQMLRDAESSHGGRAIQAEIRMTQLSQLDGLPALTALIAHTYTDASDGPAMQQLIVLCSGDFGTYYFSGLSSDPSHISAFFMPLIQSVRWKGETAESGPRRVDAGDFSLTVPAGEPYRQYPKAHGQILLALYPAYASAGDDVTCLRVLWLDEYDSLTGLDDDSLDAYLKAFRSSLNAALSRQGASLGSLAVKSRRAISVGGRQGLEISLGGAASLRLILVTGDEGTYCFICTQQSGQEQALQAVLDSIEWKNL